MARERRTPGGLKADPGVFCFGDRQDVVIIVLTWRVRGRRIDLDRPIVAGILNVTPDSFSDGGQFASVEDAVQRAINMIDEGADIIDIGGESTRPQNAQPVSAGEEQNRVVPVIEALARERPDTLLSIDTVKSAVAEQALAAGAHIVNDVSGLRLDPGMGDCCARYGAGVVLMHSRGGVTDMGTYANATYGADPVTEILDELQERVAAAERAQIPRECIAVDPGIGFSKRSEHSVAMLAALPRLVDWGLPVFVGVSRKRFIGEITGVKTPRDRVFGTVGACVAALDRGAHIFRVHDVAPARQALDVAWAIRQGIATGASA